MSTKILVVEDDPETRDFVTVVLELEGYQVIVANNGIEGIDKTCVEEPNLIVTDIRMPGLNGIEMIRELRSRRDCQSVPILAITAYHREHAEQAIQAGASRALAKPFPPDLLGVVIKDLLKKTPQSSTGNL